MGNLKQQFIRRLFIGDNLAVMRGLELESADLIYLDPPFNSKRIHEGNLPTKIGKQQFKDIWRMSDITADEKRLLNMLKPDAAALIDVLGKSHGESWRAYLTFMAVRLDEMRRLLKPTGSVYLHCDSTMSAPLKLLMDMIFGKNNFRNEIVWLRATKPKYSPDKFGAFSDHILFFAKSSKTGFNLFKTPISEMDCAKRFNKTEKETGRRYYLRSLDINRKDGRKGEPLTVWGKQYAPKYSWQWSQETTNRRLAENPLLIVEKDGALFFKQYADGMPVHNIWTDIAPPGKGEDTGWATQKPLALLERIIKTSSDEGGLVMDPFCGCATACVAAEHLGRQWIGIDIDPAAAEIMQSRVEGESSEGGKKKVADRSILDWRDVDVVNARVAQNLPKRSGVREINKNDPRVKKELYDRQKGKCAARYCPNENVKLTYRLMEIDRIKSGKRGGRYTPDNVQLLCSTCNRSKGAGTMKELERSNFRKRGEAEGLDSKNKD